MANSIRTPRQGLSVTSRRIAEAVDNEEWQKFRVSLKGTRTQEKLERLKTYWETGHSSVIERQYVEQCDECVRVDNYIKALCRGGQLYPSESLQTALDAEWQLEIKRN